VGVSLQSNLYVGKVTENGQLDEATTLKKALTEFLKAEYTFDIISISQCIIKPDPDLEALVQSHVDKNRIVIAAIGNDALLRNSNNKRYPGYYNNCISVGACESNDMLSKYTCFPSKADIFCYGTEIKSFTNDLFPVPLTGTSQATAIVAGAVSLIVSYLKKKKVSYNQNSIRNLLKKYSQPLSDQPPFRVLRPALIFDQLTKLKQNEDTILQDFINANPATR
jgi:hypothetical protein